MDKQIQDTLAERYAHAASRLAALLGEVSETAPPAASFDAAQAALEALPLSTEEFATARNRLGNARSYADAGEYGAARFELRLLARSLPLPEAEPPGNGPQFTPDRGLPQTGPSD